jgi:hypothetical protein
VAYLLATRVLIAHFAGGEYVQEGQLSRYGGSLVGLLEFIVTRPFAAAAELWDAQNGLLVLGLLAPLAFLPLAGLRWLLPAVPVQVALLFTDRATAHTIDAQYVTQAIPFVAVAMAAGVGRVAASAGGGGGTAAGAAVLRVLTPAVVGAALVGWIALANDVPISPDRPWEGNEVRNEAMRAATDLVPDDAAVTATSGAWVRLSEREVLFPYPEQDAGSFVSGAEETPETACWAVLATDDPAYLQSPPGPEWELVAEQDVYQVLRRC